MRKGKGAVTRLELAGFPLFDGIDGCDIDDMLAQVEAHEELFEKGQLLFREGDVVCEVGLILSGSIHIMQNDFWGNVSLVSQLDVGDVFGTSSIIKGELELDVHGAAFVPTKVLYLNTERILHPTTQAHPGQVCLISNLTRALAHRNTLLASKIAHTSKRSTYGKVLSYLSEQARLNGSDLFTIPFNRQHLADYLEVDRAALSKVLARMKDEGVLDYDRSTFKLMKP